MPYIDGFEFSAKLRAEGYETPLIFMTAQDTIDAKLKGFDIGADDVYLQALQPPGTGSACAGGDAAYQEE